MSERTRVPSPGERAGKNEADAANIAHIEAEIDQTRNAISGDLRSIGERLSPENLKEEAREVMLEAKHIAVETLHEAKDVATNTFREVKDTAMNSVTEKVNELRYDVRRVERETLGFLRENAIPLALIGVGVSWFVSKRRSERSRWDGDYAPRGAGRWRYPEDAESRPLRQGRQVLSQAADRTRDMTSQAADRAQHWVEDAEHKVSDVTGRVRDFAGREYEHARELAHDAEHRVNESAARARRYAEREFQEARELTRHATEAHPLAVAAAAVAAGIGVGLLLPQTRRESELLGPPRDRLIDEAKDAVQDWTQTVKDTARDMKGTLSGNAQSEAGQSR